MPGSIYSVILSVELAGAEMAMPPVIFRFSCIGLAMVKTGQVLAAFVVESFELPLAIALEIEGLPVMTKLPQIPWTISGKDQKAGGSSLMNAFSNSADCVTARGPK
jgi:hypothetical protein